MAKYKYLLFELCAAFLFSLGAPFDKTNVIDYLDLKLFPLLLYTGLVMRAGVSRRLKNIVSYKFQLFELEIN